MAEFGEQLRKAREEKGMTQQSLAEKVYVTRQTVSRWEGGERYPDLITLKKLSVILGKGIDELLDNQEVKTIAEKNPLIEKPLISNLMVILYALIIFIYAELAVNGFTADSMEFGLHTGVTGTIFFLQLFAEIAEILILIYGLVRTVQGKMNAKSAGIVTAGFFAMEALRVSGYLFGESMYAALIMIPYIPGAAGAYCFYLKKNNHPMYRYMIVIASLFGVFRVAYAQYSILMYADHMYSMMNSVGALLTLLIYVLFIYQMEVLYFRRKRASEL